MALSEDDLPNGRKTAGKLASLNPLYWEQRHNELTQMMSKISMGAQLVEDSALMEQLRQREANAESEAQRMQLQSQINAVQSIVDFNAGQSKELMDRVLDRDKISNEEASELVAEMKAMGANFEKISGLNGIERSGLRDLQADQMYDTRLGGERKAEILRNYLKGVDIESPLAREMMDVVGVGDRTMPASERLKMMDSSEGRRSTSRRLTKVKNADLVFSLMQNMNEQLDIQRTQSSKLEQLTKAITEETSSDEDLKSNITTMIQELRTTEGSSDSLQGLVDKLETASNLDNLNRQQLSDIVSRMATDTTPERTLFTLGQINDNLEAGLMKDDDILQALESNNLSDAFLNQAEKLAEGNKGFLSDLLGGAMAATGLGGLSDLIDPGDIVESVMDSFKKRRGRRGGAPNRGVGRGMGRGGRGVRATVGGFFKAGAGRVGGLATGAAGMMGGLGNVSGVMGTLASIGRPLMSFAKVAGPAALVITSAFDAFEGWNNASEILDKTEEDLTTMDKAYAATLGIMSGLTFGLVDPKEINEFFQDWGSKISSSITGAFEWLTGTWDSGIEMMRSTWNSATSTIESMFETPLQIVDNALTKMKEWLVSTTETVTNVFSWMTGTRDEAMEVLSSGWEVAKNTVEKVYMAPIDILTGVVDKVEGFFSTDSFLGGFFSDDSEDVTDNVSPTSGDNISITNNHINNPVTNTTSTASTAQSQTTTQSTVPPTTTSDMSTSDTSNLDMSTSTANIDSRVELTTPSVSINSPSVSVTSTMNSSAPVSNISPTVSRDAVYINDHGESSAAKVMNAKPTVSASTQMNARSDELERNTDAKLAAESKTVSRSRPPAPAAASGGGSKGSTTKAATRFDDYGLAVLTQQVF